MKFFKAFCLILIVSTSFVFVKAQDDDPPPPLKDYFPERWEDYFSPLGLYTIRFPNKPTESQQDIETKWGKIIEGVVEYGREAFVLYKVRFREYPKAFSVEERTKLYDEEYEKLLNAPERKAVSVSNEEKRIAGLPARMFVVEYDEKKLLREIYVIRDTKHYFISVETFSRHSSNVMGAENGYEKIAMNFLNSFRFIADPPRKGVTTIIGSTSSSPTGGGPIGPSPKPVPKLSDEYDDKSWKEYKDEKGGYFVLAIGSPNQQTQTIATKLGAVEMFLNIWRTSVGEYGSGFVDYPVAPSENDTLKLQYDNLQSRFIGQYKLLSQKDFTYEGYLGREAIFESATVHLRGRWIYIGNRFYQLVFATRPITNQPKAISDFVEKTSGKFFNSFKVTNEVLGKAEAEIKELKAPSVFDNVEIGGTFEGNTYNNNLLGFSLTLPTGWMRISEDETHMIQTMGRDQLLKKTDKAKQAEAVADKNVKTLILMAKDNAEKNKRVNFMLIVEKLPYKKMPLDLYMKFTVETVKTVMNYMKSVGEPNMRKLAGRDFAFIDFEIETENLKAKQKYAFTIEKGVSIGFAITYTDESELAVFEQILSSIKFK